MSADLRTLDGRVAIVGAGLAGLMTALRLAPRPVVVVSKTPLGAEGSTLWAQGGLAAALGRRRQPGTARGRHARRRRRALRGRCRRTLRLRGAASDRRARAARRRLRSRIRRRLRAGAGGGASAPPHRPRRRRRHGARGDARAGRRRAPHALDPRAGRIRGAPPRRRGRSGERAARRRAAGGADAGARTKW